ncbi:MAG: 16S rRNA (cytidine(1402)-2'-O)-methyltransferase [Myxococcales bacterium]|nr:16S rRNA (cytidine(1402)-2'-O)-methyltransferase [Myxococcales bacterium]MCB9534239.1 16S rRNA (cytidine(1402)-2'-O)-methyltransferase [Myxococcales bacterium]
MTLFVVATPIGNLEDLSPRAARVLREVDLVLAEDTRRTRPLLEHIGSRARLRAYHDHTDRGAHAAVVTELAAGVNAALVSDAGTPCISDPGFVLVRDAIGAGVSVVPVPGASSLLAFAAASGLPADRLQFVGFAPRRGGDRDRALAEWTQYAGTTVALESPNRIVATLAALVALAPDRPVVVGRELTKLHEEWIRGSASEVHASLAARDRVLGEVVLGIGGAPPQDVDDAAVSEWLRELVDAGVHTKTAAQIVARRLGTSAREAYALALALQAGGDDD